MTWTARISGESVPHGDRVKTPVELSDGDRTQVIRVLHDGTPEGLSSAIQEFIGRGELTEELRTNLPVGAEINLDSVTSKRKPFSTITLSEEDVARRVFCYNVQQIRRDWFLEAVGCPPDPRTAELCRQIVNDLAKYPHFRGLVA